MDVDGFTDPYLASLYDIECPWHPSDDYYLGLVMSSRAVLDVGCGTGIVHAAAARRGHPGRLVGVDPSEPMLAEARKRAGVEWRHGTLPQQAFTNEFDLMIMTGPAFQELRAVDDVRGFLDAARQALHHGGRLAFETRNPLHRAWESWTPDNVTHIVDPDGVPVRVWHEVEDVAGPLVTFTETYDADGWDEPTVARSTLRFLPAGQLDHLLCTAGYTIDERYGNWDRSPFTPASPEIITVASVY